MKRSLLVSSPLFLIVWFSLMLAFVTFPSLVLAGACPPADYTRQDLFDIKAHAFEIADDQKRNALAIGLLACIADPDPLIRDGVVYEGLTSWLRGEVFYVYGEPGRLARAVFYTHRRDVISKEDWQAWIAAISAPTPMENWADAYSSQAGLAKRHNTLAFLTALLFYAQAAGNENGKLLANDVMNAIKQVM